MTQVSSLANMDRFSCGSCSSIFQCFSSLLEHKLKKIHGNLKKCSFCSYDFCQGTDLLHHYQHYHLIQLKFTVSEVLPDKGMSSCPANQGDSPHIQTSVVTSKTLNINTRKEGVEHKFDHKTSDYSQLPSRTSISKPNFCKKMVKSGRRRPSFVDELHVNNKRLRKSAKVFQQNNFDSPCEVPTYNKSQVSKNTDQFDGSISGLETIVKPPAFNFQSNPKPYLRNIPKIGAAYVECEVYTHQGALRVPTSNIEEVEDMSSKLSDQNGIQKQNPKGLDNATDLNPSMNIDYLNELEINDESYADLDELELGIQSDTDSSPETLESKDSSSVNFSSSEIRLDGSNEGLKSSSPIQDKSGHRQNASNMCERDARFKKVPNISSLKLDGVDFNFLLSFDSEKEDQIIHKNCVFRCLKCKFSSINPYMLIGHMKQVHSDVIDLCNIPKVQDTPFLDHDYDCTSLKGPWSKHKVLKMSDYLPVYKSAKLPSQDRIGKYPCTICGKVFTRLRFLRRHHVVHSVERPHLCEICGKSYKCREALRVHVCTQKECKRPSYKCPECGITFSDHISVHRHLQIHPCGALVCNVCGEAYARKSALKLHARVHDLSRPFACSHSGCTWRFDTEKMCKVHELGHKKPKFHCPFCNAVFKRMQNFKSHQNRYHNKHLEKGKL